MNIFKSQIEERDRTIKLQQSLITKLEEEKERSETPENIEQNIERINIATQTDRVSLLYIFLIIFTYISAYGIFKLLKENHLLRLQTSYTLFLRCSSQYILILN